MIQYQEYKFSKKELISYTLLGVVITSMITYAFYKSVIAVILALPLCIIILKYFRVYSKQRRLEILNEQFREGILSLSAALNSGYAIENAFQEAIEDLGLMYNEDDYIIQEFRNIIFKLKMNYTIEELLYDFAERANTEDICNFAEVFVTAKRTGGDIVKIINATSKSIGDKIEIRREIVTLVTAKKLESRIMCLLPLGIIYYMWLTSPGYLDRLYHNGIGILLMTVLLGVYVVGILLAQKITKIEV